MSTKQAAKAHTAGSASRKKNKKVDRKIKKVVFHWRLRKHLLESVN